MTSKERIRCAFEHREADMVPIGEMHIASQIAGEILGREAITTNEGWGLKKQIELVSSGRRDEYVERKGNDIFDIYDKLGLDMITIELDPPANSSTVYKDVTDTGWMAVNEATGDWSRFVFDEETDTELEVDSSIAQGDYDDIERLLYGMEASGCKVDESIFDSTKIITERNKGEKAILLNIPNVIPTGLSWTTMFFEIMIAEPEMAQRLCDLYLKRSLSAAKIAVELGADALLVCSDWAYNNGPLVSPAAMREFWIPQINEIARFCHDNGVYLVKHTDGNVMSFADDFFGMGIDGYQGIEGNAGMELAEIKRLYGDKITFMGNVDCAKVLPFGSERQIIEATKQCIRDGAPGGGFILSSSNTIGTCVPVKNYMTMLETAEKYRKYPICF